MLPDAGNELRIAGVVSEMVTVPLDSIAGPFEGIGYASKIAIREEGELMLRIRRRGLH